MRFRAHISNVSLMQKIVKSLSVTAKHCIINLTPDNLHFIVSGNENGQTGVQIWSSLKIATLFEDYRIESRSENQIYLEVALDALGKALRSAEAAGAGSSTAKGSEMREADVSMKLGKKNDRAVLIFDIKGQSWHGATMDITHDVQCVVLSPKRVQDLKEPMCPPPDVHIQLPPLDRLKGVASRMSHLGSAVRVSADSNGKMTFSVRSSGLTIETTWEKLTIPKFAGSEEESENQPPKDRVYSVNVGIKSMLKLLSTTLMNSTTIACICDDFCLIAYIYIGEIHEAAGVLTLFIPAMAE